MKTKYYTLPFLFLFAIIACKKNTTEYKSPASVLVIHCAVEAGPIKMKIGSESGFSYANALALVYGTSMFSNASEVGNNDVTVVNSIDSNKILIHKTLDLKPINTLYIVGQSPNIESIFRSESNFPSIQPVAENPDYSFYLRFVNLSPNSAPININVAGSLTNEVAGLSYKGITDFKKYVASPAIPASGSNPAVPATPNYVFEIKDAATNTLLNTITVNSTNTRFKTAVVVIRGTYPTLPIPVPAPVVPNPFGAFQINYN